MRDKPSEQSVAEVVVTWLHALDADIYQEVECAGGVADIVARLHAELWIIEVKTSPSLALLVQAMDRRRLAHRVFVAAPHTRTIRDFAGIAREIGVGVLDVNLGSEYDDWDRPRVTELAPSRRWNSRPVALAAKLRPEHKTHARAGAIGAGGRWTPFRDTCEQIKQFVILHPGSTVRQIIDSVQHHYRSNASARSSIYKWIELGKVERVQLRDGLVYPIPEAA